MRRWLWPYAMFVALVSLAGIGALLFAIFGSGVERAAAQLSMVDAVFIEPGKRILVSMLDMVAPFDLPAWVRELYAILALVVIVGLILSVGMGVLLLPVFYALYRGQRREGADRSKI